MPAPEERQIELSLSLILVMWAAGLAALAGAVAWWRIVGPGFVWLAGSVATALAVAGAFASSGWAAWIGVGLAAAGTLMASRPGVAAILLVAAAAPLVAAAAVDAGFLSAIAGAAFLGGVTSLMLLGHWYLVDPRLPRWALFRLDAVAAIALVGEVGLLLLDGTLSGDDNLFVVTFVVLSVATLILLIAVWFALAEPSYPAVMAATGLGYLAVLTALGVSVVGRAILDPTNPL